MLQRPDRARRQPKAPAVNRSVAPKRVVPEADRVPISVAGRQPARHCVTR